MPLDEVALRKPDFQEGVRIVLGDGQEWSFPLPKLRLVPCRNGNGDITAKVKPMAGQDKILGRSFDLLWTLSEQEPEDAWDVRFSAASHLLLSNYNLTDDDLGELIYIDLEDPNRLDRWLQIENVLRGIAPKKPSPAGSSSPA